MSLQAVYTEETAPTIGPYVQAISSNEFFFLSGQIPANTNGQIITGPIEETTEAVFVNVSDIIKAARSSLDKVVKTTIFLSDMGDFQGMNAVYQKHFSDHKSARSCAAVKGLPKGVAVEMECIVALK